jgi:long-chain acyl-CoA synthetase
MSHAFALLGTLVAPVCTGARAWYLDRFIPSEIGDACVEQKITLMLAIPSMYNLILRARDLAWAEKTHLRLCVSGGEVLPRGVADRFEDVFCRPLLNGYGMTETSPVLSLNVPWANKPGSVGRPIPGVDIKIVDDDDQEVPTNTEGEIVARGPNVMAGYLNHDAYTAERYTADGFFRTGDLGLLDDDGYLFIRGRKKEIIIISGENVSPAEIEAVLLSHPMVADAAVIGVDHDTRGEAPVAFVTGRRFHTLTAKDLKHYCRERMANFKVPRNAMNKILKRALPALLKTMKLDEE